MRATDTIDHPCGSGLGGMEVLFNDTMLALPKMGDALVEPALQAYPQSDDPGYRAAPRMSASGRCSSGKWAGPRTLARPTWPAAAMAERCPCSSRHQMPSKLTRAGVWDDSAIVELCASIEGLGATLTDSQREMSERAVGQRNARYLARAVANKVRCAWRWSGR